MSSNLELSSAYEADEGANAVLQLAERLREAHGGELDESAILAVSEATGAPLDYVRAVLSTHPAGTKTKPIERVKTAFIGLDPNVRRYVASGAAATFAGVIGGLRQLVEEVPMSRMGNSGGFLGILSVIAITLGIYNIALCRDGRAAAISGGILGSLGYAMFVIATMFLGLKPAAVEPFILLMIFGAVGGFFFHRLVDRFRPALGMKDPVAERQELLRQLVEIQDKLRSGEQGVSFLSVDIVGSTKMKQAADALSVEFTFNEYHRYAEAIARKHLGRVHSTAGDGVTMAFDHPKNAFAAARNFQAGLIELNTFRNKIGQPISVRCGIHSGKVMAPDAGDIRTVNFASVIDIAAHMQKEAPTGGIVVSENAASLIPGGAVAVGSDWIEVSGHRGVIWTPKVAVNSVRGAVPPPPPTMA